MSSSRTNKANDCSTIFVAVAIINTYIKIGLRFFNNILMIREKLLRQMDMITLQYRGCRMRRNLEYLRINRAKRVT